MTVTIPAALLWFIAGGATTFGTLFAIAWRSVRKKAKQDAVHGPFAPVPSSRPKAIN